MKSRLIVLLGIITLALFSALMYVYAQGNYYPGMMRNMMNGRYYNNNENYTNELANVKLSEDAQKGKELFESLCAQCHGQYAQGQVGPNIQGISPKTIDWALKNVSMMNYLNSNLQLKKQQNIYYISEFLKSIKR